MALKPKKNESGPLFLIESAVWTHLRSVLSVPAGLKNDCACVRQGDCLSFRSFDQWKVWRWTRPFQGNVWLQDGTERRSLWTFSVNGNSLTFWKDSRGMFVYLDSLKPADKFLKASLLCGNDGSTWWVGLIDFILFKNIIELLSSELSMDVTW